MRVAPCRTLPHKMPLLKRSPTASTRPHKVCSSQPTRSKPRRMAPNHWARGRDNDRGKDNNRDRHKGRASNKGKKVMVVRVMGEGREIILATNRGKTNRSLYRGRLALEP